MLEEIRNFLSHELTPVTFGNVTIDALLDYETRFESDVTSNPVEDGFPVADHVTRKPIELSITAVFTPSALHGANPNRLQEVLAAIQMIYRAGEPVTVALRSAIYENMVLVSAPLPRTVQDGVCYKCRLNFVQVRRVTQRTEDVPEDTASEEAAGSAGASEQDAGTASQTEIGTGVIVASNIDTTGADYTAAGSIQSGKEITAQKAANALKNTLTGQLAAGILF